MRNAIYSLLMLTLAVSSCTRRNGPAVDEHDKRPTRYDYQAGIDGEEICEGFQLVRAEQVVPLPILMSAPEGEAMTLTFDGPLSNVKVYLFRVQQGQYVSAYYSSKLAYEMLGELDIFEDGFVALAPPEYLRGIDPVSTGVVIEFPGRCLELRHKPDHITVGKRIHIRTH